MYRTTKLWKVAYFIVSLKGQYRHDQQGMESEWESQC